MKNYAKAILPTRWFTKSGGDVQIRTSKELADFLGFGYDSDAGVSVSPGAAMAFGAVYNCVRVLSESIGMLPIGFFKREGESRERIEDHPVYRLIAVEPNEFQTAQEFWETVVAHLATRGNHYSLKTRVRGQVRELLPLDPSMVEAERNESFEVTYSVYMPDGRVMRGLTSRDIFHVPLFSTNGYTGLSPVRQARNTIGVGIAAERHGSKMFKNKGRLLGLLTTDQDLKKDQRDSLRDSWDEAYSGVDQDFRTAVLSGGLQWQNVSLNAHDTQFIEQRKFTRSEVAGIFRVPPHMIGALEEAHFNNVEQMFLEFVQVSLMPYLTRIEHRIAKNLLSREERTQHFAKFNTNALLRGDTKARAEFYQRMVQNGAMSPNEIRALEDMNPREGGDIYLTPVNMAIDGKPVTASKPGDDPESED